MVFPTAVIRRTFTFIFFISFAVTNSQTWQTLNANTLSWRFEDMYFIDHNTGWVVDGGGQILNTSDGGQTWTQQYYNSNQYFRSVEFANEQVGFAGTLANGNPNAQLFRTTLLIRPGEEDQFTC